MRGDREALVRPLWIGVGSLEQIYEVWFVLLKIGLGFSDIINLMKEL